MASVREVSSITEDLLCPVCLSVFQDPRLLGCGHNFCLSCLESCVIPKGQHQGTCPECRAPFDLKDAVYNRVLANLAEKARLLKLEEGFQSGVSGSSHFCEEHEEPLKLFCRQDEAPVCVICRDLPQHQGHNFLPIKNAVNSYREKLKASLEPLENGMKWATNNQSRQLEAMEELESLTQNLCGSIFFAFEELREILNEREQSIMETVKQMKEDNQADMERMLEDLKDYASSRHETISSIQAALDESNDFAFLKETKELMRRIQGHLRQKNEQQGSEAGEDSQRVVGGEEKKNEHQDTSENNEGEAYGEEAQDVMEDEDGAIVPVSSALGELEELLDFEGWKDMLRSISIEEMSIPDSPKYFPALEEDVLPSEESSIFEEAEEKETTVVEERNIGSFDIQTLGPSSVSSVAPTSREELLISPLHLPNFAVPPSQPLPFYNNISTRGWRNVRNRTPRTRWPHSVLSWGRGTSQSQPFWFLRGSHPNEGNDSHQDNWRFPRREPSQSGEGRGWRQRQGCFNKQGFQFSGSIPGESGGGPIKNETHKPRQAYVSGQGGAQFNKQRPQSSTGSNLGQSGGQSIKKEPAKSRGGGQGGSGQGRGSAKKGSGPSQGSQGAQHRPQASHCGGRGGGRGSGSAKGPQKK